MRDQTQVQRGCRAVQRVTPGGEPGRRLQGKAFHIIKDTEVTLPGDVKYLRDLSGKFLHYTEMVGIRLRIRIVPSDKFCFYLHNNR